MAGSRIYVQEGIYEEFLAKFTEVAKALGTAAGDPFTPGTEHGPQVSQIQFDVCRHRSPPCVVLIRSGLACNGIH
jgi:acyl-CoA reductase-like NAD-dependent aldehyde dehydrogenase